MGVQHVNLTLACGIDGLHDLASLLLTCKAELTETTLHASSDVVHTLLQGVRLLQVLDLVLITHFQDRLLSVAAAILDSLNDIAVTHVHGIDYSFCRETNLTAKSLDSRLHGTYCLLQ